MSKTESKPSKGERIRKYIAYATGEIVIVTIGILIAFYLNNWYQERVNRNLEKEYYQSLKLQLNEDLNTLTGNLEYNDRYLMQFNFAKEIIQSKYKDLTDTLGKISLNLIRFSDFRRKSNIFQTLINTGEMVNIKNHRITEELQNLEEIYVYINRLKENHINFIFTQILNDLKNNIRTDPFKVERSEKLFSYQFQNNFVFAIMLMNEESDVYQQAKSRIDSIIALIDKELE